MAIPGTVDRSFIERVVVGLIFAPLLVWLFWKGSYPFFVFLVFLTAIGQWELYRMFENRLRFSHRIVGFTAGLLIITATFVGYSGYSSGIITAAFIFSCVIEIITGKEHRAESVILSLFVSVYPALFNAFLLKLSAFPYSLGPVSGQSVLLYVLFVIWIFDTMSYFSGRIWGKHPFFQSISPKKTVEGFFGGMTCVVILAVAAGIYIGNSYIVHMVVLSVLAALAGQAGDLSVSIIKRDRGVKDSSNLIPGHGGILDRFDSLFFAGPVSYAYLLLFFRLS